MQVLANGHNPKKILFAYSRLNSTVHVLSKL